MAMTGGENPSELLETVTYEFTESERVMLLGALSSWRVTCKAMELEDLLGVEAAGADWEWSFATMDEAARKLGGDPAHRHYGLKPGNPSAG